MWIKQYSNEVISIEIVKRNRIIELDEMNTVEYVNLKAIVVVVCNVFVEVDLYWD